jgi:hypothetical protein
MSVEEMGSEGYKDSRHGDESDGEESLELPVVGALCLVGLREGSSVVDGSREDGCIKPHHRRRPTGRCTKVSNDGREAAGERVGKTRDDKAPRADWCALDELSLLLCSPSCI